LHWGPGWGFDGWKKAHTEHQGPDLSADFHKYKLVWTKAGIQTFIDDQQVLNFGFTQDMYTLGGFPSTVNNPWEYETDDDRKIAPFNQRFFLVLNVAVGGTNGYFKDGECGKPWADADQHSVDAFYNAKAQWYPTWNYPATHDSAMQVKSIVVTSAPKDDDEEEEVIPLFMQDW